MKLRPPIILLALALLIAAVVPPRGLRLTWDYPASERVDGFYVYQQDAPVVKPAWTMINGRPVLSAPFTNTDQLTNGWRRIALVTTKDFDLPTDNTMNRLHAFAVTAVRSGNESEFSYATPLR